MNTGVTGFCQFCHTPYNTYHHIISLFILMTVYVSKSVFILHMTKLTK